MIVMSLIRPDSPSATTRWSRAADMPPAWPLGDETSASSATSVRASARSELAPKHVRQCDTESDRVHVLGVRHMGLGTATASGGTSSGVGFRLPCARPAQWNLGARCAQAARRALLKTSKRQFTRVPRLPVGLPATNRLDLLAVVGDHEEPVKARAAIARIEHSLACAIRVDLVRASDGSPSCPPGIPLSVAKSTWSRFPCPSNWVIATPRRTPAKRPAQDLAVDLERI
jgi:hypothetical protein